MPPQLVAIVVPFVSGTHGVNTLLPRGRLRMCRVPQLAAPSPPWPQGQWNPPRGRHVDARRHMVDAIRFENPLRQLATTIRSSCARLRSSARPSQRRRTRARLGCPRAELPSCRAKPRRDETRRDETIRLAGARLLRFQLIINVDVG